MRPPGPRRFFPPRHSRAPAPLRLGCSPLGADRRTASPFRARGLPGGGVGGGGDEETEEGAGQGLGPGRQERHAIGNRTERTDAAPGMQVRPAVAAEPGAGGPQASSPRGPLPAHHKRLGPRGTSVPGAVGWGEPPLFPLPPLPFWALVALEEKLLDLPAPPLGGCLLPWTLEIAGAPLGPQGADLGPGLPTGSSLGGSRSGPFPAPAQWRLESRQLGRRDPGNPLGGLAFVCFHPGQLTSSCPTFRSEAEQWEVGACCGRRCGGSLLLFLPLPVHTRPALRRVGCCLLF